MKTAPHAPSARRLLHAGRISSSPSGLRIVGLWLAASLIANSVVLPPAAHAYQVRGIGEAALIGHDLTDPEDDGDPENNTNYNAVFTSSEEPGFGNGPIDNEAAFNVFDNKIDAGGNDKWCCGDHGNFPTSPLFIDATFATAKVLRHFTLTSGEDSPERDPLVWEIQGSNDGVTFTTIYARNNPTTAVWTARKQVVEFLAGVDYALPAAYKTFRFTVSKTQSSFQLSEIEYFETPAASLVVTTATDENDGSSDPSAGTGTSLREALIYAATLSGPQTITFSNSSALGAVNFHDGTAHMITLASGELVITSNLTVRGPGAKLLAVDGNASSRVFHVASSAIATIDGLTITNGALNGNNSLGAGILNEGDLTVSSCAISSNSITGNTVSGGGICNGGAALGQAKLTVSSCTISNNSITCNSTAFGGGIFNTFNPNADNTVTVLNSTISGNSITGVTTFTGGGIHNRATLSVTNSTISGNSLTGTTTLSGGGIDSAAGSSPVVLNNSIVAGNIVAASVFGGAPDIRVGPGGLTSNGHNFIGVAPSFPPLPVTDQTFASTGKTLADLLETAAGVPVLKDNGGATFTIALVPGSPALDAGDPNFNPSAFTPALINDQRGAEFDRVIKGKPASMNAIVDIGAFEVQVITFAPGIATNGVQLDASDAPLDLKGATIGATPPGGTFSGPGVDANGVFHPELLDPGTYLIAYTTTTPDAFGNTAGKEFTITITATKPYVRILATVGPGGTGIDVPNEPVGTKFTQLGLASMDTAELSKGLFSGVVGARVRIKPAGGAEVPAIYQGMATGGLPVSGMIAVRGGDAAPDGHGGTLGTFASFQEPVFGAGFYAFGATITGAGVSKANDTGLWSSLTGAIDLVVAEGGTATDGNGAPMAGVLFDKIQSYALSADGAAVSFVATLKGTGVKGTNKTGVFQYRTRFDFMSSPLPPLTKLIFRTGDLFSVTVDFNDPGNLFDDDFADRPVKSLKLFVPAKTIPGQRRSYGSSTGELFAFATFAAGREAVLGWIDNGFFFFNRYLAIENTTVGHPGVPSINGNGDFAMRAGLSLGAVLRNNPNVKITAKNDQVILTGRSQNNIGILAQEGSPVSSTNPQIFTAFDEPAFNDNYRTAFFAKVKAPGLPASQQRVLIYEGGQQTNFEPEVIARTGFAAPDQNGALGTVVWKEFTAMVLPDSDFGPVFLAKLSGPGVTPKNSIGLWATDLDGTVRLLLRTGDMVPVNGDHKIVSLINTLGAALDSAGQGRYVDQNGNVSATLSFTDGTTALVHFGLPTALH